MIDGHMVYKPVVKKHSIDLELQHFSDHVLKYLVKSSSSLIGSHFISAARPSTLGKYLLNKISGNRKCPFHRHRILYHLLCRAMKPSSNRTFFTDKVICSVLLALCFL